MAEGGLLRLDYRGRPVPLSRALAGLEAWLTGRGLRRQMTLATTGGNRLLDLLLLLLLPSWQCRFLPLDPSLPEAQRRRLLEMAGADLVLDGSSDPQLPEEGKGGGLSRDLLPSLEALRLLLATSGTTGEPALIELHGRNLLAGARAANARLELSADDLWLGCLPTHHIGGLAIPLRCLLAGAGMSLMARFDARELLRRLETGGVTHLSLVPTQLHRLLEAGPAFRPPSSLRVVLLGGAPARASLVQKAQDAGWPVCPSYGLTEAASQVATCYPPPGRWREGMAGLPLDHVEVQLDDGGRIRLRGESIAACRIGPSGAEPLLDEGGWLQTRDLGRFDEEGRLVVLGREDDLIISGGEKVHPALLEETLSRCPGLDEVAVIGVEDDHWGQQVVACYSGDLEEARLEQWARAHLGGPHRPRRFVRLADLPRNSLGKLLRQELRRKVEQLLQPASRR